MTGLAPTASVKVPAPVEVCPHYRHAVELIGKRWTGTIVQALLPGPMRYSGLSTAIPEISDRLLSGRLKELESCGIVSRRVLDDGPVHVEYELTAKGRALEPTLISLHRWARKWNR